jgi:hypothetical protein
MKNIYIASGLVLVVLVAGIMFALGVRWGSTAASATTSEPQSLALQAQCATQAQKTLAIFEQGMKFAGYDSFSQQNHYSPNFNECFEIISYSPIVAPGTQINTAEDAFAHPNEYDTFMDAYENNDLADCTFYDDLWGVDPQAASNPANRIKCTIGGYAVTYQQLQNYINQRMATGTVQF